MSETEAPSWTLEDLEHQIVAASLAHTDILELVNVRFRGRLTGRLASLFTAAAAYFTVTRGPLTREALFSLLADNEPDFSKHEEYLALYDAFTAPPYSDYSDSDRRWFLHAYDQEWQKRQTGLALASAAEAMRGGHHAHGREFTGASAAWQVLAEARLDFENSSPSSIHEAELTSTGDSAKQDYHIATESRYSGCPLGLPEVNDILNGLRPGDMYIITAFAHEGKSFMMLNDAHTSFVAGRNVSLGTGEMNIKKYRNRFIALHSAYLARKGTIPQAIPTMSIDRGILTPEEHAIFLQVIEDYTTNPTYGKFFLFQFPFRSTPSVVFNKFSDYDRIVPLDMGIVDYLGLLTSERSRVSRREELDDLIRETKALALDFAGGRGLALEVGYQTNRQSFERAQQNGYYDLTCFSESSEAEKSADAALYLLSQRQNPNELKCFSGSTLFLTAAGPISFESAPEYVNVIVDGSEAISMIRSFGEQPLVKVTFVPEQPGRHHWSRGRSLFSVSVDVTPDHHWILVDGSSTANLSVGDSVPTSVFKPRRLSKDYQLGISHGFVLGDGSATNSGARERSGLVGHYARMFGDKASSVADSFPRTRVEPGVALTHPSYSITGYVKCERNLKLELPPDDSSADYLGGFIWGWLLADGDPRPSGSWRLRSTNYEAMDWVKSRIPYSGLVLVGEGVESNERTNKGIRTRRLRWLTLAPPERVRWKVLSVGYTEPELVYCAMVPDFNVFALAPGMLTANCGFLKNRDGELGEVFHVQRNLRHAELASLQSSRSRHPAPGFNLLDV